MEPPDPQHSPGLVRKQSDKVEADLVRRAMSGDRQAFGKILERYAAPARRLCRAILRNPEEADDAAQDAFLSAWVKLGQYDPRRPLGPWLMRIVANAAKDRRRRREVRRTDQLSESVATGEAGPDRQTDRRMLEEHLREALDELPVRYRAAVVLFDLEGYSHAEIARILGVPEGTVRSDVFHARRMLRQAMEDWKENWK
jgi:RNA polymerase sigma-70 factor (ECF subfamily)